MLAWCSMSEPVASTTSCGRSRSGRSPVCACRRASSPTPSCSRQSRTTDRSSSWPTSPHSPGSSTRRWPCRTSTRATASPSEAWRRRMPSDGVDLAGRRRLRHQLRRAPARAAARLRRARRRRERLVHELCARGAGRDGRARRARGSRRAPISSACCRAGPARWSRSSASAREDASWPSRSRAAASTAPIRRPCPRAPASAAPASSARSARATTSSSCSGSRRIFDADAAEAFGLASGQVTVLIHSGSRGLGHQVCTDYVTRDGRRAGAATGSSCPTASSPAHRSTPPEGQATTWGRWRRPRTSPGPTASVLAHRVREAIGSRARACDRCRHPPGL